MSEKYSPLSARPLVSILSSRPRLLGASIVFAGLLVLLSYHSTSLEKVQALTHRDNLGDVRNQTLGFQKVMVVSLPDRSDKRDVWSIAAAASDFQVTWVDGVIGEEMSQKAIPAGWDTRESNATLGCYRGHLNAIRQIVENRWQSALIFEDDVDWDIMLKSQLIGFAEGSRFLQGIESSRPLFSPYGDDWDLLWLGHTGARNQPEKGRYWVTRDDPTVIPSGRRKEQKSGREVDTSPREFQGDFTRIIHRPEDIRGAFSYALSFRGAAKFLYHFSVMPEATTADKALSRFCSDAKFNASCIAAFPSLMDSYHAAGAAAKDSDRRPFGNSFRKTPETDCVSFPVKSGLERFVNGQSTYESQWPDETMLREIDPRKYTLPHGRGVILSPDVFKTTSNDAEQQLNEAGVSSDRAEASSSTSSWDARPSQPA